MRRLRRTVLFVVALSLLTYGLVDDLRTQSRLHAREVQLTRTKSVVAATAGLVATTSKLITSAVSERNAEQGVLDALSAVLASDEQELAQAMKGLAIENLNVATLNTCLTGVRQAVSDLQTANRQGAISAISNVAAPCESLQRSSPGGPVYPFDFPDPDVINAGGTYFAYGTNAAGGNIQIIESSDLSTWKTVGNALPGLPAWASPNATWAPGVMRIAGSYLLYYTVRAGPTECISVARASHPQGPFVDSSPGPLVCQSSVGGSIDPAPYTDSSGNPYLTWKSNGGGGQPATIWAQALNGTGRAMAAGSSPVALLFPSQSWEGSVVEGPFMWSQAGAYYLFYSGNEWDTASYAEGVAACQGPLGPCTKVLSHPLYGSQPNLVGPGGASVFGDSRGNVWIAFHGWLPGAVGYPNARLLFLRMLTFVGGVPQVQPPS